MKKSDPVRGRPYTVIEGAEFTHLKDPRLLPVFVILVAAALLGAAAIGAYVDRNRTPTDPHLPLYSPLTVLPVDGQEVGVLYFWGTAYARFESGRSGAPDVWIETNDLAPEYESKRWLSDDYGLPRLWWPLPELAPWEIQNSVKEQLERTAKKGKK